VVTRVITLTTLGNFLKTTSVLLRSLLAESQEAVLFTKGQLLGKFGPGKHTLNTENLPLLRHLFNLPFGGKNPFTAQVWFVNKLLPLNIDWKTDSMMIHDPDYQTMVPLISSGRYGLNVVDAERFLIKLVGTAPSFTAIQLTDHFRGALISKTKSVLLREMQNSKIGIKNISAYLDVLSEQLKNSMQSFWEDYGFSLNGFYITTIEVDANHDAGQRILDAMARQSAQAIGGYTIMGNLSGGLLQSQPTQGNNPAPNNFNQPAGGGAALKDVYCSNCSKKFANDMKFCPHCGDPYTPCPKCGSDNDKDAKRCVSCGTQLNAGIGVCGSCQTAIPNGSAFCPNCGKPAAGVNAEGSCRRCGSQLNNSPFCPQCGLKKQ
jgi:membrane protease subunit (stomatin/prohibitin family)